MFTRSECRLTALIFGSVASASADAASGRSSVPPHETARRVPSQIATIDNYAHYVDAALRSVNAKTPIEIVQINIEQRDESMRNLVIAIGMIATLASCTQTEKGTVIGAGTGALIGGVVSDSWGGAAIGAVAGGLMGNLIGRSQDRQGYCIYRDRYGRRYEARCQ